MRQKCLHDLMNLQTFLEISSSVLNGQHKRMIQFSKWTCIYTHEDSSYYDRIFRLIESEPVCIRCMCTRTRTQTHTHTHTHIEFTRTWADIIQRQKQMLEIWKKFKYMGRTTINKNWCIKSILNSRNAYYHSIQNYFSPAVQERKN
jgi:hypothetical protein